MTKHVSTNWKAGWGGLAVLRFHQAHAPHWERNWNELLALRILAIHGDPAPETLSVLERIIEKSQPQMVKPTR